MDLKSSVLSPYSSSFLEIVAFSCAGERTMARFERIHKVSIDDEQPIFIRCLFSIQVEQKTGKGLVGKKILCAIIIAIYIEARRNMQVADNKYFPVTHFN